MTPREAIMRHMLKDNIAICVGRQFSVIGSDNYDIVFISEKLLDYNLYRRGGELVFPLYIYPEEIDKRKNPLSQVLLFEAEVKYEVRQPNIRLELFEVLKKNFKKAVTPEEIFYLK